jgi:VWFA-related protein
VRYIASLVVALLAGVTAHGAARQTPAQQAPPVFRASVDLVQVDVSVLDRVGLPVEGLAAADFTILEDGKPQDVAAFAAVSVPEPEPGAAPWLRDVTPDVRSNTLGDGRLFALIIDDATLPFEVRTLSNARRIARQVIDRLGPDDLAAVIYTRDTRRSVDFTTDRARLLASVEALAVGSAYTDKQTDNAHFLNSVRTLGQVAAHLASVPQRRKALIYVSTGVPVDSRAVTTVTLTDTRRVDSMLEVATSEDLAQEMADLLATRPQDAYGAAMHATLVRAQNGNVNIYSIDPAGLGGLQAYLQQRTSIQEQDLRSRAPVGRGPVRTDPLDAMQRARLSRDYLESVAANSGGRAILNTNDVDAGLTQIFRENSAYYLLGYRSTREPGDRRVRKVQVKVARAGVTAHTRNAYFDPRTRARPADRPVPAQLASALAGVLPVPDVALQAHVAPFASPNRRSATLAIAVGVRHGATGDVGARVSETLLLQATALTPRGDPRASSTQSAHVVFRSGTGEDARYEILARLEVEPGRYQIRLAAHSAALDKNGSVYLDVDVPDFGRESLQVSGVVLSADPGWRAAPADALADFLPVVPTASREFGAGTRVSAFARVYDRGRESTVTVRGRITDERGTVVFRRDEPLAGGRFTADGAADYRLDLPISTLTPGRYLFTLEATAGARTIARQVRFAVK